MFKIFISCIYEIFIWCKFFIIVDGCWVVVSCWGYRLYVDGGIYIVFFEVSFIGCLGFGDFVLEFIVLIVLEICCYWRGFVRIVVYYECLVDI